MHTTTALLFAFLSLLLSSGSLAAPPIHKCLVNGTVTFQQDPCPSGQARKAPTLEALNAERKRQEQANGQTARRPAPAGRATTAAAESSTQPEAPAAPTLRPREQYRCDGRQHCSQMRSCDEAKHFLAQCPAVKMDGDGDGIPCEQQHCRD